MRLAIGVFAAVCLGVGLVGCGQSEPRERDKPVRIVHVVLPGNPNAVSREDAALEALLRWLRSGTDLDPAALVIAGTFDASATLAAGATGAARPPAGTATPGNVTPSPAGATPAAGTTTAAGADSTATTRAKRFSAILENEPLGVPIYVVPGARAFGAAEEPAVALASWRSIVAEIQKQLEAKPGATRVVDLASCYEEDLTKRGEWELRCRCAW